MVPILKGLFSSFKETSNHQEKKKREKKKERTCSKRGGVAAKGSSYWRIIYIYIYIYIYKGQRKFFG
jgi:hypothetical protein